MNETPAQRTVEEKILGELKKMNKLITIANGQKIEETLGRYTTSDERKMIWVLMDGKRQAPDIAQIIKKTKRTVDTFLQSLENAGLVEQRAYGRPPVRSIEYVPASWVDLVPNSTSPAEQTPVIPSSDEQKQTQQEADAIGG
jgi:DNA-binding HxlR family transcriptional regulator